MMLGFCNKYKKKKKTFSPWPMFTSCLPLPRYYSIYYETLVYLNVEKGHVHFEGEGGRGRWGEGK